MNNAVNIIELIDLFEKSKGYHTHYEFSQNGNVEIWWNNSIKVNSNSYKACGNQKYYKGTFKEFVLLPFTTTYYDAVKLAKLIKPI